MPIRSYYDVLDVQRHASPAEIKTAYRVQAMRWHPDRNPASGAVARFRDINEAYHCLREAKSRADYDAGLRNAEARAQERGHHENTECEEYPLCMPCAVGRVWNDLRSAFTVKPENLITLFSAIDRSIRRAMMPTHSAW